jgi:hypothetical protein
MKSLGEILKESGLQDVIARANAGLQADDELEAQGDVCTASWPGRRKALPGHPDFGGRSRSARPTSRRLTNGGLLPLATTPRTPSFGDLSPRGRSSNPLHQESFAAAVRAAQKFADLPSGWLVLGRVVAAARGGDRGPCVENGRRRCSWWSGPPDH